MSASRSKLDTLYDALVNTLLDRVKSREVTAADLNVARAFLKDNGIEVGNPSALDPLKEAVTDVLPFEAPDDRPAVKRKGA